MGEKNSRKVVLFVFSEKTERAVKKHGSQSCLETYPGGRKAWMFDRPGGAEHACEGCSFGGYESSKGLQRRVLGTWYCCWCTKGFYLMSDPCLQEPWTSVTYVNLWRSVMMSSVLQFYRKLGVQLCVKWW